MRMRAFVVATILSGTILVLSAPLSAQTAPDWTTLQKGYGAHSDQERILEAEIHRFVRFSYEIVYDLARQH